MGLPQQTSYILCWFLFKLRTKSPYNQTFAAISDLAILHPLDFLSISSCTKFKGFLQQKYLWQYMEVFGTLVLQILSNRLFLDYERVFPNEP